MSYSGRKRRRKKPDMSQTDNKGAAKRNEDKDFLCGVCEGFYGKPWTPEQRQELFCRMKRFGMNTYLYAPKDDYKHRLYWRDLYNQEEAELLCELIAIAKENHVTFVYALSPGLDIVYSDREENERLNAKFDQVREFGCESFALLFDDIEPDLVIDDVEAFDSMAHAQITVTNQAYKHLNEPNVFLFCPTEYCTTRAVPDLATSQYLQALGDKLHAGVDILWTGPKVVPRKITLTGINELRSQIKRAPVIWDNIHANDYDQTRLYLGPYDGRPLELRMLLKGVLTNPNCEFEANFIAMHTLAQWSTNKTQRFPSQTGVRSDTVMDTDPSPVVDQYHPQRALHCAVDDWLPELYKTTSSGPKRKLPKNKNHLVKDDTAADALSRLEEMDTTSQTDGDGPITRSRDSKHKRTTDRPKVPIKERKKMEELEPLSENELMLICDLFYLPYEHGPRAVALLKQSHWLISNVSRIADAQNIPKCDHGPEIREWYEKAIHFHECHKDLSLVVDKFVNIPNRDLLYQLYNYLGDMRSCLTLVNSYIKWHGMGNKEPFRRGEQEPWVHRSGLYSEFRRLLPLEGQNDMFPPPGKLSSGNKVFTIRPYYKEDKVDVYRVCRQSGHDGLDSSDLFPLHPELLPDYCIGCLLEHYPRHSFVIEDDAGICGYVTAAPDVRAYQATLRESWLPAMRDKYPLEGSTVNGGGKERPDSVPAKEIISTFHREPLEVSAKIAEKYPGYIQLGVVPSRVEGLNTPTRLLSACIQGLKDAGVKGIHTKLPSRHLYTVTFLFKLAFDDIEAHQGENKEAERILLGRPL